MQSALLAYDLINTSINPSADKQSAFLFKEDSVCEPNQGDPIPLLQNSLPEEQEQPDEGTGTGDFLTDRDLGDENDDFVRGYN